jgi:DNA invertase Pin-like site-specific DNA recombinase
VTKDTTTKIVTYARVSLEEMAREGISLEAQRATLEAEAERRGWTVVQHVEEVGSTDPRKKQQPKLAEAVALIEAGEADGIMVTKLDRLSRSVAHFAGLLERFTRLGHSVVCLDIGIDTSTIMGAAAAQMGVVFAEMERRRIGQRTSEAMQAMKAQGKVISRPTVPPETKARIRDMRESGMGLQQIADRLTEERVPTARGGKWYASTIKSALET